MADLKISQLVDGGAPQATDEFVIDRAGADNFKVDWASLKAAAEANAVLDGDAAGGVLSGTFPNPGFAADMATQAELDAEASTRAADDTTIAGGLAAHISDPTDAHVGTAIGNTPAGGVAATTVQGAINELDTEKVAAALVVLKSLYDANTILAADADDTPAALTVGASTFVGRKAAGNISAMSVAEALTLLGSPYVPGGTDVPVTDGGTGASTAAGARTNLDVPSNAEAVLDTLFDANTVLAADADNTPAALTMGASTILARLAAGNIKAASVAEIITLLQAYTVGGTDVAVTDGGTGASTAAAARTNLGIAAAVGGVEWTVVTKGSDESVVSSTVQQADDALFFTPAAGGWYEFQLDIIYASPAGAGVPDFKFSFGEDATARGVVVLTYQGTTDTATSGPGQARTTQTFNAGTAATNTGAYAFGYYYGGTGASAGLWWSQVTSDVNATIVRAGSVLRYRRII